MCLASASSPPESIAVELWILSRGRDETQGPLPVLYDILAVVHSDSYRSSLRGISENGRWAAGTMRLALAGRNARHPVAH